MLLPRSVEADMKFSRTQRLGVCLLATALLAYSLCAISCLDDAPLIAVAGPTDRASRAGGRLALAFPRSGRLRSVQVYRHLNIGAAKLPESERQGVPHHLIDVVEPDQVFTAGEYLRSDELC